MLLLKVTKVITGDQKMPKMGHNNKLFFCPKGKRSLGRRPKPFAGARNKPAWQAVPSSLNRKSNPIKKFTCVINPWDRNYPYYDLKSK